MKGITSFLSASAALCATGVLASAVEKRDLQAITVKGNGEDSRPLMGVYSVLIVR